MINDVITLCGCTKSYVRNRTYEIVRTKMYVQKCTYKIVHDQKYKKVVLINQKVLGRSSQLCFGSRRANLGMPGDLVIQERLVALKSADFLGTKVRALVSL